MIFWLFDILVDLKMLIEILGQGMSSKRDKETSKTNFVIKCFMEKRFHRKYF